MLIEPRNGTLRATPIVTDRSSAPATWRLLIAEEVWVRLRMDRSTFYKRRAQGRVPEPHMYNGNRPLWLEAEIDCWIECGGPALDRWLEIRKQFKILPPRASRT